MVSVIRVVVCVLLLLQTAAAQGIKRIAILDFENAGPDRSLDWVGVGLGETMHQALKRIPSLVLVDRGSLDEVMKEFRLGTSRLIQPGSAVQMGKVLGAQSLVVGTYQVVNGQVRLSARIIDVETSVQLVSALVSGPFNNILKLQEDLARQLIAEIQGTPLFLEPKRFPGLDAFRAFAQGAYSLRNNDFKNALAQFDRALAIDRDYADAQFHRALALKRLGRLDDAIAAFRKVLPDAKPARRVAWTWQAPFAEDSKHGLIVGLDQSQLRSGLLKAQKSVLFHERRGTSTIFYLPDVEHHRIEQLELPNEFPASLTLTLANERLTVLAAVSADRLRLYAISADNSLRWRTELTPIRGQLPMFGLIGDAFYTYDETGRLTLFDDRTLQQRWTREAVALDRLAPPIPAGNLMIARTGYTYRAIRLSDGSDAWTVAANVPPLEIINERFLVVFEPNARVFIVDMETGKALFEMAVAPLVAVENLGFASLPIAKAALDDSTLVVVSAAQEVLAVDLRTARLRWRTPMNAKVATIRMLGNRVYAGSDAGELIVIDGTNGALVSTRKVSPRALHIDYVARDLVVASSDTAIFGLEASGSKRWEYPSSVPAKGVMVFKNVVAARTSTAQITTLDARTGEVLWQHVGEPADGVHIKGDAFFVVEGTAIKEFSMDLATREDHRPADKEVLVELAGALRSKGLREEADLYIDLVKEIDPDYPPLRLMLGELATYANLVGRTTPAGRKAIAEMKSRHGLLWESTTDGPLFGTPTPVGNRIINIGQALGTNLRIVALDPADGHIVWRVPSERLVAAVTDGQGRLWYVSGQSSNPSGLVLYQVQVDSGERREMARWTHPAAVNALWLTYAADRLFVAALSLDAQSSVAHAGIDAFEAPSGKPLWKNSHDVPILRTEIRTPFGLFMPQGGQLIYSIGREIRAVRASDGSVVDQRHEERPIGLNWRRGPAPDGPVYFATDQMQIAAYDVERKEITRAPRPETDSTLLQIRDGVLFGFTINASVFAYDLKSGEKWRHRGNFLSVIDGESQVWALRKDNVLVQLDRSTGRVIGEHPTLWRPSSFTVVGNRLYAFTSDGLAYSLKVEN